MNMVLRLLGLKSNVEFKILLAFSSLWGWTEHGVRLLGILLGTFILATSGCDPRKNQMHRKNGIQSTVHNLQVVVVIWLKYKIYIFAKLT